MIDSSEEVVNRSCLSILWLLTSMLRMLLQRRLLWERGTSSSSRGRDVVAGSHCVLLLFCCVVVLCCSMSESKVNGIIINVVYPRVMVVSPLSSPQVVAL